MRHILKPNVLRWCLRHAFLVTVVSFLTVSCQKVAEPVPFANGSAPMPVASGAVWNTLNPTAKAEIFAFSDALLVYATLQKQSTGLAKQAVDRLFRQQMMARPGADLELIDRVVSATDAMFSTESTGKGGRAGAVETEEVDVEYEQLSAGAKHTFDRLYERMSDLEEIGRASCRERVCSTV